MLYQRINGKMKGLKFTLHYNLKENFYKFLFKYIICKEMTILFMTQIHLLTVNDNRIANELLY